MKKKFPLAACLAAAALVIPLGPASAGSSSSSPDPKTLAGGLVTPLSLAVGRDGSVLLTQNFGGKLDRVEDDGQLANVYTKADWDVGGVETRRGTTYFLESVGAGGGNRMRSRAT